MKFMKPGKTNEEDRLNFIKFWADYVRTHSDKEWSRQQNIIINSQLQISRNMKWTGEQFEALRKLKTRQQSF
jgi:hypothetical protein